MFARRAAWIERRAAAGAEGGACPPDVHREREDLVVPATAVVVGQVAAGLANRVPLPEGAGGAPAAVAAADAGKRTRFEREEAGVAHRRILRAGERVMVEIKGFEPLTPCLPGKCSTPELYPQVHDSQRLPR